MMPYIDLKCTKCSHTFKQNVERCEELYNHDLCKSHDFETLIDEDKILVKKENIEAVIKYVCEFKGEFYVSAQEELIKMLEDLTKNV